MLPDPENRVQILTFMLMRFLLLLDEQVKHLRLHELFDEVQVLLRLHSFDEALFLKRSQLLVSSQMLEVICKMSNSFHKEAEEGFRHHAVQLLRSCRAKNTNTLYTHVTNANTTQTHKILSLLILFYFFTFIG